MLREALAAIVLCSALVPTSAALPPIICDNGIGAQCGSHCPLTDLRPECLKPVDCSDVWGCGPLPDAPPELDPVHDRVEWAFGQADYTYRKASTLANFVLGIVTSRLP